MNDTTASPTPKERLALSRAELLATMGFRPRLMGYAAGAGGLLVLLKPWRILSLSAGIALAFKAFDVVDLAAELWNKRSRRTRHQENLVSRPSDSPYPAEVPGHE